MNIAEPYLKIIKKLSKENAELFEKIERLQTENERLRNVEEKAKKLCNKYYNDVGYDKALNDYINDLDDALGQ